MSFTCISCHVAFKEANIQREHYKTDWHRYNLKRKVVELPPVTAEGITNLIFTYFLTYIHYYHIMQHSSNECWNKGFKQANKRP